MNIMKMKWKHRNSRGFTLVEALIVVAIIVVLAAFAALGIVRYQRKLHRVEMDGYAKEIFVAAQNHLSLAESLGALEGLTGDDLGYEDESDGTYYIVVGGNTVAKGGAMLELMLPYASVDESVRNSGYYIIHYQLSPAAVLDVFYVENGSSRFGTTLAQSDYAALLNILKNNQDDLMHYGASGRGIVGYYGGVDIEALEPVELNAPLLKVFNGDTLYAKVWPKNDPSDSEKPFKLTLIVHGNTSGADAVFTLPDTDGTERVYGPYTDAEGIYYTVLLDDITVTGKRFQDYFTSFFPGEDIELRAKVEPDGLLGTPRFSTLERRSSLFDDATVGKSTVSISSFRHLENLDADISNLQYAYDSSNPDNNLNFVQSGSAISAVQTADLDWIEFRQPDGVFRTAVYDTYYPVTPAYTLTYDGQKNRISSANVHVWTGDSDAGLFGILGTGCAVSNLLLEDFSFNAGAVNAGALAGTLNGTATNVVAYHTVASQAAAKKVTASTYAGGLIGCADGAEVTKCAAALLVESTAATGTAAAGGLIGSAEDTVIACSYSGGHTNAGAYVNPNNTDTYYNCNVKGVTAGGLVGTFAGESTDSISNSYSTCSVKSTLASGGIAGGLVGELQSGAISGCYAAGLVGGTIANAGTDDEASSTTGAFLGKRTDGTVSSCQYFMIVNESKNGKVYEYLAPVGEGTVAATAITAFDEDADEYNGFVDAPSVWRKAEPYDDTLDLYYHDSYEEARYSLGSLGQFGTHKVSGADVANVSTDDFVATHYGDWPAPELWVFNVPNP